MQVSKKIPFDDPQVLLGVRTLYIVSNVIILGIYLYIQQQVNKKKGRLGEPYADTWVKKLADDVIHGRPYDAQIRRACGNGQRRGTQACHHDDSGVR
jgi:Phosphate transport (Pho88)